MKKLQADKQTNTHLHWSLPVATVIPTLLAAELAVGLHIIWIFAAFTKFGPRGTAVVEIFAHTYKKYKVRHPVDLVGHAGQPVYESAVYVGAIGTAKKQL